MQIGQRTFGVQPLNLMFYFPYTSVSTQSFSGTIPFTACRLLQTFQFNKANMYRPTTALIFSTELQEFQKQIEAMSDECKNIFQDTNRIKCVREVFVDTPPTKYPNITAIEAGLSADMSVIIASTAQGNVIPPVFIVRASQVSPKWFLPLPESKYTCDQECWLWPMRLISTLNERLSSPRRVSKSPSRTNLGEAS